jgi:cyclophilin family peptidyl-prolyl cis-trans isomerase
MKKILPLVALVGIAAVALAAKPVMRAVHAPAASVRPPVQPPVPSPGEMVTAAPKGDWIAIDPNDLLVMDLAPDAKGKPRRVVIQLMPPPFSQGWVGNIRKLAAAHWWDGTSVNRVQDNYVVQWGDATEKKALPVGLVTVGEKEYTAPVLGQAAAHRLGRSDGNDAYATSADHFRGWPVASDKFSRYWPVHCYGMVGVGRNLSPDTGSGAELYTVIGHAPRHLDRNIALVGRVIEGIELLSSLPRGTGALGFYETAEERVPIRSVRIMSQMDTDKPLPTYEYLSTESASFAKYADARANRRDPFFIRPAGGADICNIPVPVRRATG